MGEHLPYKQRVSGSSPLTSTIKYAGVAELADALDLGSSAFGVQVRFLSPAPLNFDELIINNEITHIDVLSHFFCL